jgi:phosphoribosylformylglycinamidine synthase
MCVSSNIGAEVDLINVPNECSRIDDLLFSESHSRYVVSVEKGKVSNVTDLLKGDGIHHGILGKVKGNSIRFTRDGTNVVNVSIDKAVDAWVNTLEEIVEHG